MQRTEPTECHSIMPVEEGASLEKTRRCLWYGVLILFPSPSRPCAAGLDVLCRSDFPHMLTHWPSSANGTQDCSPVFLGPGGQWQGQDDRWFMRWKCSPGLPGGCWDWSPAGAKCSTSVALPSPPSGGHSQSRLHALPSALASSCPPSPPSFSAHLHSAQHPRGCPLWPVSPGSLALLLPAELSCWLEGRRVMSQGVSVALLLPCWGPSGTLAPFRG